MVEDSILTWTRQLRERGYRLTPQRRAVLQALEHADRLFAARSAEARDHSDRLIESFAQKGGIAGHRAQPVVAHDIAGELFELPLQKVHDAERDAARSLPGRRTARLRRAHVTAA